MAQNPLGNRAGNLEEAIHHYKQALEVYTGEAFSEDRAAIQNNLGLAYSDRIRGERADNLEQAIHFFQQALEVRTREAFPVDWAATLNNLGIAYRNRICGNRADNLEQAIHHYKQALEVYARAAFPTDWAMTQNNLGLAYADRIRGERADNLEQAISHYEQALEVRTREAFPTDWADTQNNLGLAYADRIRGERADNLEEAIHHYKQALEVYTGEAFSEDRAAIQNNLGIVYSDRIRGERAENLEKAIRLFQQALEVRTRGAFPVDWAMTQNNLATAYYFRIHGEHADNLERTIHHYKQALEVYTREAFPERWAITQNNLGNTYSDRIRGERADNLEQAIHFFQQALEVRTRGDFPEDWAATQNNLGNTYADRIRGERADNLEQAIHHLKQALGEYSRAAFPEQWAKTQYNLGTAYLDRIHGEHADNLEQAIYYQKQALEVFTREAFPVDWATIQNNLGNAYRVKIRGGRADNLEQAIHHFRQALMVRTREAFPEKWAMTQNNLGTAYLDRIQGERADNLEQAIQLFQQALKEYTRAAFPKLWALTQHNLAATFLVRIHCKRTDNLEQAIAYYIRALEVRTLEQHPADHFITIRDLGNLYFDERNWMQAFTAYNGAIQAGDTLLASAYTEVGRRFEVGETSRLYARAAYSLLQMERPNEALLKLEQGKTRLLAEALTLADADLAILPDAHQEAMHEARRSVHELEAEMRLPPDTPARRDDRELAELMSQARADLNRLIGSIREEHPGFMPTGLDLQGILSLIPEGGALVAPLVTSQGSAAFVIPHGAKSVEPGHVVWLDDLADEDLLELLQGPADTPEWGGWMGAYLTFRDTPTKEAFERWQTAIETATSHMWKLLMGRIHERLVELGLAEGSPLVLMPQGGLGLLPLHAAWRMGDGGKRFFLDDYVVSYAPSAHALSVGRDRLKDERRHGASLLAVVNPTGDLRYAGVEGEAVAALFPPDTRSRLDHGVATQEAVVEESTGRSYLHFSCHGYYDWQEAMSSGLMLADSTSSRPESFTLSEVISSLDLGAARLVTLSACETGITEFRQSPDEYIGLPAGFLQAGAPCVVSTLWAVDDMSTALLMERFYQQHLDEDLSPSRALREAQRWLRDGVDRPHVIEYVDSLLEGLESLRRCVSPWSEEEAAVERQLAQLRVERRSFMRMERRDPGGRPFSHPYYWAAFTVSGADTEATKA